MPQSKDDLIAQAAMQDLDAMLASQARPRTEYPPEPAPWKMYASVAAVVLLVGLGLFGLMKAGKVSFLRPALASSGKLNSAQSKSITEKIVKHTLNPRPATISLLAIKHSLPEETARDILTAYSALQPSFEDLMMEYIRATNNVQLAAFEERVDSLASVSNTVAFISEKHNVAPEKIAGLILDYRAQNRQSDERRP